MLSRLIRKALLLLAAVAFVLFAIGAFVSLRDQGGEDLVVPATTARLRTVVRVIDADTLDLDGGERIRLVGVDAPETNHPTRGPEICGREATAMMRVLVEGRYVRLAYDRERQDRFDRTLAYVVRDDGMFVNAEIIRLGYAHAYRKFQYQYKDGFLRAEAKAHENKMGCLPRLAPNMARE